ncbi:hypothetical protein SAMN05216561_101441 [Nocardioides psychrotolerans]|uniref:AAA domain-containing protein n=1 Tax=Nocardioides psychrotolerans TaxID=1005945 RepID=A0A1I3C0X3_9ACTN|nr:hypothetical protein SAMN05216561_101441 [Nocardioides psychrotolerans]
MDGFPAPRAALTRVRPAPPGEAPDCKSWLTSGPGVPTSVDHVLPHLVVLRGNAASGKSTPAADNIALIAHMVRYCTGIGVHVILEGILVAEHYRSMLHELVSEHPGPSYVFYLDVPREETVRRHQARPLGVEVPVEEFRGWYAAADLLGVPGELERDRGRHL